MKKSKEKIMVFLFGALLFAGCSASKTARELQHRLSGEWTVQTVSADAAVDNKNKIFNEAGFKCFIGSVWHFNSKGGTGFYALQNNGDCPAVKRNINWKIGAPKGMPQVILFSRLNGSEEEKYTYTVEVAVISATNLQLKYTAAAAAKPSAITFNLTKN